MRLPEEPETPAQINIVSMIDVVFAILTFFIISSLSLNRTEGLPVKLPSAGSGQLQTQTKLVLTIDDRGGLLLNRQPVTLDTLATQTQQLMTKESQNILIINADEKAQHGTITQVIDRVQSIANLKIAIATKR
jgi:biopolymer transport protein ExbD